jgi:hypothetical protein
MARSTAGGRDDVHARLGAMVSASDRGAATNLELSTLRDEQSIA